MNIVFAFGDSITLGCWDKENMGWTSLLRKYIDNENPYPSHYLYNLGIRGDTSRLLLERFDSEVKSRKQVNLEDDTYKIIIEVGANDSTYLTLENRFKVDTEEYRKNILSLLQKAKSITSQIFILNITPVNDDLTGDIKSKGRSRLNKYVDMYNKILNDTSTQTETVLVDINSEFKKKNFNKLLTKDGLHPNSTGHQLIFETLIKNPQVHF